MSERILDFEDLVKQLDLLTQEQQEIDRMLYHDLEEVRPHTNDTLFKLSL